MKFWQTAAAIFALSVVIYFSFAFIVKAAPTVCAITNGCTGTSTAPSSGQILIGGPNGQYLFVASSTLGGAAPVQSVFGRTGAVTAQSGDYTTSLVPEGSNLYWTQARFDGALTGTTSLPQITTLANLSLPYSQLTNIPADVAFSTTSADYWKGVNNFFSTSSTAYWLSQNQGAAFSTTSANVWGASKGYITWPWTPSTNYGVPVQSTTTPLWMNGAGVFASSTNARPAVAANSSSSGRALEIVSTGTGPGIWQQQLGTNAFLWTAIAKSENTNPIDIAHNPDSPTLSTTKTFSLANNTNARGVLALFMNAGTNKAFLVDHNDTTDWATVIDSTGFGLQVIGGGSNTVFQAEDGPGTVAMIVDAQGDVGIGNTSPTQKLNVQGEAAAQYFTATSTSVASTFPYASTTALTNTGRIFNGSGASSNPSYTFASDPDTGVWNSTGNSLALMAGGSNITWNSAAFFPGSNNVINLGVDATNVWNRLFVNYASTTAVSATTLCFTGDGCITEWPSGGGSGPATSTNPLMGTYMVATSTTATSTFSILKMPNKFGGTSEYEIFQDGDDIANLQRKGGVDTSYSLFQILGPGATPREATLALKLKDANGSTFLDLYNNNYGDTGGTVQFGIRLQKRDSHQYKPFVFDYYDGSTFTEVFRIATTAPGTALGNFGIGTTTPGAKFSVGGNALINGNVNITGTNIQLDSTGTANNIVNRGATTNFAGYVLRTAGADQWAFRLTNDSTNNSYLRDLVNGRNILTAVQGGSLTLNPATFTILSTGYVSQASSTVVGLFSSTFASTTALTVSGTASTSKFFADGLVTCNTGNMLTWAAGVFGCEDDSTGGGGVWPFTPSSYAGVANQSTTTPLWLNGTQLVASSTLAVNATTTGSQYFPSLTSALLGTDENGKLVSTTSIGTGLITGILPVSKGGTGSSAFTAGSVVFSNGTILTQDNSNFFWDDSNNRLGIGTTTPTTKVFVEDTASPFLTLSLNDSSVVVGQETGNIGFHINDSNSAYGITSKISNISNGTSNSFGNLAFFTGTNPAGLTEKVRIESNGQTGVGTTTPASQLHVASSGNLGAFQFTVEETDGVLDEELYSIRLNGGTFQWGALTTDLSGFNSFFGLNRIGTAFESFDIDETKLFVNASGNIGIATATPQWPLSIYKTTGGQLSLINGGIGHLFSSYPNGMLVLATTSPATFATSTVPLLTFNGSTGAAAFGSPATTTFTGGATFATAALYNASGTTTIQNTNGTVIGNGSHGIRIYPGTSTTTIEAF